MLDTEPSLEGSIIPPPNSKFDQDASEESETEVWLSIYRDSLRDSQSVHKPNTNHSEIDSEISCPLGVPSMLSRCYIAAT